MHSSGDRDETAAWHGIAVVILTEDREQEVAIRNRLEATRVARVVLSHLGFPVSTTDPIIRRIQDQRAQVVVVDVHAENLQRALAGIELIEATTSEIAIFAIGETNIASTIVDAMRAGACEYVDRRSGDKDLLDAFARFSAARTKKRGRTRKARVFTIINAKGGTGATTVAVNTAVALQRNHGQTALIDFALIGHAAVHLNLQPRFFVLDALQNLHRMDASLLDGLMTAADDGLNLLAGSQLPNATVASTAELARLFELLVGEYRYVVVDCSSRIDNTTKLLADLSNKVLLVGQMDVVSLWSARLIRTFLEDVVRRNQVRLVLNRYKKAPGFTEGDVEKVTGCQILWKLPNDYKLIAPAIDKGKPIAGQSSPELSRSFRSLAALLAADDGLDWTGGSIAPDSSVPPLVPVLSPGSGEPRTLPSRKTAWET
ncbi:MAG TPA: AAA family ATPase [Terriglobales bacterium]|nr:AAA family ATPase [Terriglobales bacterium]